MDSQEFIDYWIINRVSGSHGEAEKCRIKFNADSIDFCEWYEPRYRYDLRNLQYSVSSKVIDSREEVYDMYVIEGIKYIAVIDKFRNKDFIQVIVRFQLRQHNAVPTTQFYGPRRGGFNVYLNLDYSDVKPIDGQYANTLFYEMKNTGVVYVDAEGNDIVFKLKNLKDIFLDKRHFKKGKCFHGLSARDTLVSNWIWLHYSGARDGGLNINLVGSVESIYTQDKKVLNKVKSRFEKLYKSVESMEPLTVEEMVKTRGAKKGFKILMQLMEDFDIKLEDILMEIEYCKYEQEDTNELALYRNWLDSGLTSTGRNVFTYFNRLLVSALGVEIDHRYYDVDLLMHLNESKIFCEEVLKLHCSNHEWGEKFELRIDKNEKILARFDFSYTTDQYHNVKELIEMLNICLEREGIRIIDADDGSDSYRFVIFRIKDLKRLEEIYGKHLAPIISPIIKIK